MTSIRKPLIERTSSVLDLHQDFGPFISSGPAPGFRPLPEYTVWRCKQTVVQEGQAVVTSYHQFSD